MAPSKDKHTATKGLIAPIPRWRCEYEFTVAFSYKATIILDLGRVEVNMTDFNGLARAHQAQPKVGCYRISHIVWLRTYSPYWKVTPGHQVRKQDIYLPVSSSWLSSPSMLSSSSSSSPYPDSFSPMLSPSSSSSELSWSILLMSFLFTPFVT